MPRSIIGPILISWLAILMGKLFQSPSYYVEKWNADGLKILYTGYDAKEDLYLSFYEIYHYGKGDPSVIYSILEALYTIYMMSAPSNLHLARAYAKEIYREAEASQTNSCDLERLKSLKDKFHFSNAKEVIQKVMDRDENEDTEEE